MIDIGIKKVHLGDVTKTVKRNGKVYNLLLPTWTLTDFAYNGAIKRIKAAGGRWVRVKGKWKLVIGKPSIRLEA